MNAGLNRGVALPSQPLSPPIIRGRFDPVYAHRDFGLTGDGYEPESYQFQQFLDAGENRQAIIESAAMKIMYTGQLYVRDGCKLRGNGATLIAHPGAGVDTTGLHLTDASWTTGPSNVLVEDLIMNGNATARRASGGLSGTGQCAAVYCVGAQRFKISGVKVFDSSGDGIYVGGNSSNGRRSFDFVVEHCWSEAPSRNCFSLVGSQNGKFFDCTGFNATYGKSISNISAGFDFEPDGATSSNITVDAISCRALYCDSGGFIDNVGPNVNCNWVSCYAEGNFVGFLGSGTGGANGVRVIGARYTGNTTTFSNITEKIPSFPS